MDRLMINNVKVVGFLGLLALLFVFLKLNGTIVWSWWWVLAPLWVPYTFILAIASVVILVMYFKFKK